MPVSLLLNHTALCWHKTKTTAGLWLCYPSIYLCFGRRVVLLEALGLGFEMYQALFAPVLCSFLVFTCSGGESEQ